MHSVHSSPSTVDTTPQNALGTDNISTPYRTLRPPLTRDPTSHRQSLERTLRPMVVVVPVLTLDMQRHTRRLREALQPMHHHLRAEIADLLAREAEVDHRVRPVRQVNHRPAERLVERGVAAAEAHDRLAVAEASVEGRAERQEYVFGRVVVVDHQVAARADRQRPARVLGQRVQHVVQKADAGVEGDLLRCSDLCGVMRWWEGDGQVRVFGRLLEV